MGWIDNYWISWWYHLHGWHTTGCSPPKRFHPLAMVNTGKPKEYNPFPHLKHRPGNHGWNFTHIWNHRMGVFNIRGMGLEKKTHLVIWFFMCFSSSTCKNHQPEPACTDTPEAWQPWMLANRSRAACSRSLNFLWNLWNLSQRSQTIPKM